MFYERNGYHAFTLAGVDVSFSVSYLFIMGFILVMSTFQGGLLGGLILALAITLSVLIHEYGHAVVCKLYKLEPSILLHGFGGLCFHRPASTDARDIAIVVAGPLIEIIFGVAAFFAVPYVPNAILRDFVGVFAWVSIIWGGLNLLLPLYPLDGGKLFLLILRRFLPEARAQDISLKVSMAIAVPGGLVGIVYGHFFLAFLAFFIFMDNYNALNSGAALIDRKAKVRASDGLKSMFDDAKAAFDYEDWREAARLCHVIRSYNEPIPNKMMGEIWFMLGASAVKQGDYDEALGWLERAPDNAKTRALIDEAERHLDAT
jgi:Zn-dependent protease